MGFKRKSFKIIICSLLAVFLVSGVAFAATGTKNLKALYKDIKVYVDGKLETPAKDEEPFIVDGRTYVPLRFAAEALNAKVDWDGQTNTIKITQAANPDEVASLKTELIQKNNQIAALQFELNKALEENKKNKDDVDGKLKDLQKDLNKDYDSIKKVTVDYIKLSGDEDDVDVTIEVDLDSRNKDYWKDLSNRDLERYIEDIVKEIQDEIDSKTEVKGEIVNTDDRNKTLVRFTKDGTKKIDITFRDSSYRGSDVDDIEDYLIGETFYITSDYKFEIYSVDYDSRRDYVTVELQDVSSKRIDKNNWDDLRTRDVERDVEYICEEIASEYDSEANITIERVYLNVLDKDRKTLGEYRYEVEDRRLR